MNKFIPKYFLATNSSEGFVSSFEKCYSCQKGWRAYIIKGGPGTGKSSFMKFLQSEAEKRKIELEVFPCSSDLSSLDGIIFPRLKVAVLDGTAPHIVEPKYVGVCEEILNFGQFWESKHLTERAEEIIKITNENKAFHKVASGYLESVGRLMLDNLKIAASCTEKGKAIKAAEALCKRYIPRSKGEGFEWVRYLGGVTPTGISDLSQTAVEAVKNNIVIEDSIGSASGIIMEKIRDHALNSGYEIITIKNSFLPSQLIDHIIIPQLSLSFVTYGKYQRPICINRKIHSRRFVNRSQLSKSRERIRFNNRLIDELLLQAVKSVALAKEVHDSLEDYYIKAMDFDGLNSFSKSIAEKIFSLN